MKIILISYFLLISCTTDFKNNDSFNHENNLKDIIKAYIFLSENHDLLHIMMGEYQGSPIKSFNIYKNKIKTLDNNLYLEPILLSLNNIKINKNDKLENANKFDALVDYYQIGLQMMIEGILKGYGYSNKMPQNSDDYKKIMEIDFSKFKS